MQALETNVPWEAFVCVDGPDAESANFARSLVQMYQRWAEERGMRLTDLTDPSDPRRTLLAVSGFGAFSLLAPEDGLHVLETPHDFGSNFDRVQVRVRVVPQPIEPGDSPRQEAVRALAAHNPPPTVVRRYREEPSPLVRDSVRNWRTGRLDQVLAGNFDLLQPEA